MSRNRPPGRGGGGTSSYPRSRPPRWRLPSRLSPAQRLLNGHVRLAVDDEPVLAQLAPDIAPAAADGDDLPRLLNPEPHREVAASHHLSTIVAHEVAGRPRAVHVI